jgi:hypothetical protein
VGRIDLLDSALALVVVFSVLVAMGVMWVRQSRRVVAEASHSHGVGLGLVSLAICMVWFTQFVLDPEPYSSYAVAVLAGTALLSVWGVMHEMRLLQSMKATARWLSDLKPSVGHGRGLAMVAVLLPGVGLVGLGPAVAVGVFAWIGWNQPKSPRWTGTMLKAVLTGLLCGGLMHWLLFDWVNMQLESGWLSTVFDEWASKRWMK